MSGVFDDKAGFGVTSWGQCACGLPAWRVRWREREGMVATICGPQDPEEAFLKAGGMLDRLTWVVSD